VKVLKDDPKWRVWWRWRVDTTFKKEAKSAARLFAKRYGERPEACFVNTLERSLDFWHPLLKGIRHADKEKERQAQKSKQQTHRASSTRPNLTIPRHS